MAGQPGGLPDASGSALFIADYLITAVGLAIACAGCLWWLVRSRRDPLAAAPKRSNRLPPEAVLIAAAVYLATALLALAVLAPHDASAPSEPATAEEIEAAAPDPTADEADTVGSLVADTLARVAGVVACLVLTAKWFEGGVRRFLLGLGRPVRGVFTAIVLTVVVLSLCNITLQLTMFVLSGIDPDWDFEQHQTIQALRDGAHTPGVALALRLGAGLVAPVAEEIFFRGLMQTLLLRLVRSRWVAILLVSAMFSLAHSQGYAIPALFALSVLLGAVYERTGSLVAPVLIHVLFNCKTLLWEVLGAM